MRWKLIAWVIGLLVVVAFMSFNLDNRSDISFGFQVIEAVPVFAATFVAFAIGVVVGIAATLGSAHKKPKAAPTVGPPEAPEPSAPTGKRRRSGRKHEQDHADTNATEEP